MIAARTGYKIRLIDHSKNRAPHEKSCGARPFFARCRKIGNIFSVDASKELDSSLHVQVEKRMKRLWLIGLFIGLIMSATPAGFAQNQNARATFAGSANEFAIGLYHQVSPPHDGNLFFSPYSIDAALMAVAIGARGQTADELRTVLHANAAENETLVGLSALSRQFEGSSQDRPYILATATSLWVQKDFPLLPAYVEKVERLFGIPSVFPQNFSGNPETARRTINDWVEAQTRKKITDLLAKGTIQPDTRLVLANAVYFKAAWDNPFPKARTRDQPFHSAAGTSITVPLMQMTHEVAYTADDHVQMVSIGYRTHAEGGSDLSMVILLPRDPEGLPAVEKSLTADQLSAYVQKLKYTRVNLFLPRFKSNSTLSLAKNLSAMGMATAFSDHADFSGIVTPDTPERRIAISAVIHKAYIDVNEEGTEAAAATAIAMSAAAVAFRKEPPPQEFRADHPFLYLIRDNTTNAILFLGRCVNPTAG
jgi:serpin B